MWKGNKFFSTMGKPRPLFVYFHSFQQEFYRKIVDFSRTLTQIVEVEGEHADNLTTTTALGGNKSAKRLDC